MKKKLWLLSIVSAILLVGCSSSDVLECRDGVIYNSGKATSVDFHNGVTAQSKLSTDNNILITYSLHEELEDCPYNKQKVLVANMTKISNKETYFAQYWETEITYHRKVKGGYICADVYMPEENKTPVNIVLTQMQKDTANLVLKDYNTYKLDSKITLKTEDAIRVERDKIVSPNNYAIGKGIQQTTDIKEVAKKKVGFFSGEKFDFYQYGDYLIKARKGWDPNSCLDTLKK